MKNLILKSSFHEKLKVLIIPMMLLTLGVGQMWADNAVTVYCAINASTMKSGDNCYTLKVNANIGDNNTWRQYTMNIVDKTKNGKLIYTATIYEKYGGVDALQFQLYQGSTWKAQKQPYSSWTTSGTFKGKMYDYDAGSWSAYSGLDDAITVYFVNTNSWTTPKAFAWSGCTNNAAWSGQAMTSTDKTYNGKTIYSISFNKRYENIIFSNNGSSQTADLTLGSTNAGKIWDGDSWETYTYDVTITFNMKDHGDAPSNITVLKGNTATAPSNPSATGYTFEGWYTNSGCTTAWNWSTAVDDNKILYAKWTPTDYNITYSNMDGATNPAGNPSSYTIESAAITLQAPTKTGYIFGGWYTDPGLSTPGNTIAAGSTGDKTFYAKWTEITLTNVSASPSSGTTGTKTMTVSFKTNVPRNNKYYYRIAEFGNRDTGTPGAGFHLNGVAISSGDASTLITSAEFSTISFPSSGVYTSAIEIYTDGPITVQKRVTFTYGAGDYYTVSFDMNEHGESISSQSILSGNTATAPSPAPTATGYTFGGWYENPGCTGSAFNFSTAITANKILYAKWTAKQTTVTLDRQSGTTGSTSVTATYDVAMPSATMPTRSGYTFLGYFGSIGGSGTKYYNANGNSAHVWDVDASTSTIYANWEETKSTITVTANNTSAGSLKFGNTSETWGATASVGVTTTQSITATAAAGFTFVRWDLTGAAASASTLTNATITLKADGSGNTGTATAIFEEDLSSPWHLLGASTPFGGWASSSSNMLQKASGSSTGSVASIIINVSALPSAEEYTFKLYNADTDKWRTNGGYWVTRANNNPTLSTEGGTNNELIFKPDVTGNYVFTLDYSSSNPVLTVTFPTKYTVTYGVGTSYTSMGSVSTEPSITSGAVVSAGTNISFTATPNPGYKFVGWYSNNACTSSLSTDNPYSVTINAATTVYAKFELMDIKINSDVNGLWPTPWTQTIMTHSSGSPAIYTYSTTLLERATGEASAPFNSGYHFNFVDSNNDLLYNFNGVQTPTYSGSSIDGVRKTHDENPTIQFGLTRKSDVTITLTLQTPPTKPTVNIVALPYYTVTLDLDEDHKGTIAGATTSQIVTLNAVTTTVPNRPTGAEGYGLDGYYTDHNGVGTKVINGDGTWIASVDGYTDADKKWIHDGDVTLYAYYKMAEIASITVSPAIVAPRETVSATPVYSPAPDGTTRICWEVQYSNGTPLPSQPAFTTEGSTVSFQAPESSATYRIEAKLYTGSTCGGGTLLSTQYATFQVAGSHTVTVQYMCDNMVIKAATEMTGKPLEWSEEFTAPTITGYTFTRWDAGDGVTIKNGDSDPVTTTTNQTIQIKAVYDGTLTAVYSKKNMIYFYNTLGWEDVWVYFYTSDKYWANDWGTGAWKGQYFNGSRPYYDMRRGQMTQIEGTDIWYFDYETAFGAYTEVKYKNVAFTNMGDQSGQGANPDDQAPDNDHAYFSNTTANPIQVIRRGDHDYRLPMFVPLTGQTKQKKNNNKAEYQDHGYWMNYPENTGYTLKIYDNAYATKETGAVREFPFPYSADKKMPLKLDVEFNEANHDYWFMVYRNDGTYLGSTYHFKQGYQDEQIITGGNNKNKITTSAPGNYTLTLTYHDNGSGTVNYYIGLNFPIANNDYRIVYNDRVEWSSNTAHTASWYHPSDIIRQIENGATEPKKDTASFFISKATGADASMKFQKATVTGEGVITWTDVASGTIDLSSITESGVYNFILTQSAGSISVEKIEPYTGAYYIRTDCAGSTKWDSYKATDHQMTFSDYTKAHEGYTHYYAHWVDRGTNVKFVIANDYSPFVSDTLTKDVDIDFKNMDDGGTLKSEGGGVVPYQDRYSANIRFMYDEQTNKLSRAYLASSTDVSKKFLVMRGNSASGTGHIFNEEGKELTGDGQVAGLDEYEMNFADDQNFIYETVIKANPTALVKLYAKYCGRSQEFKGDTTNNFIKGTSAVEILGGTYAAGTKEKMRIVYDFKTNRLVCAWLPSGDITGELDINADVMIIREHQGDAQQIRFTNSSSTLDEVKTVYGVMRFNRWTLNNKSKEAGHAPLGDPKSPYERALYWISFPFDVNLSDVFGFGSYGEDWIIEYYDGAARAAEGYWIDSPGFWRYVWPAQRATFKLEAGKGYVLALDLDRMKDNNTNFWTNNIEQIELFFPSATEAGSIKETEAIISVAEHECTIDRRSDKSVYDINKDRTKADSHWNMIGVPSYANYGSTLSDGSAVITWNKTPYTQDLPFLYEWNMVDDSYTVQSGTTYPFKSMYAYMVQYHGYLHWSLASATPSSIIARRAYAQAPQETEFKLELQQNEQMVDQTFVKLSEKEEVSANFNFDEDLCKEFNKGKANIYTIVETYIPVAGNILPLSEQTTLVPVGVNIATDGEYTFSLPDGTEGIGVTLVDNENNMRTNLALSDYAVTLPAGTYDERFVIEISPIEQIVTGVEMINGENGDASLNGVSKKLIDGVLYIIKDGKVFDARGARIQ